MNIAILIGFPISLEELWLDWSPACWEFPAQKARLWGRWTIRVRRILDPTTRNIFPVFSWSNGEQGRGTVDWRCPTGAVHIVAPSRSTLKIFGAFGSVRESHSVIYPKLPDRQSMSTMILIMHSVLQLANAVSEYKLKPDFNNAVLDKCLFYAAFYGFVCFIYSHEVNLCSPVLSELC